MLKKTYFYYAILLILLFQINAYSKTEVKIPAKSVPQTYYILELFYENSDSVYINDSLLVRGVDYSYDYNLFLFDFSKLILADSDTLRISYQPLPGWIKRRYGNSLPKEKNRSKRIELSDLKNKEQSQTDNSKVSISGTKTFRISSGGSQNSSFGQGLDLNLSGKLTPELNLEGVISDRGIDPISGYTNSQFSELDKIKISLWSDNFMMKLGDISQRDIYLSDRNNRKKMSGLTSGLNYQNFSLFATMARPKGVYESVSLSGEEGRQGPYQIAGGQYANAIVPNSETVWLDGEELKRGEGGDYQIDYLLGQITFNVSRQITNRSRIEIDFEPQVDDFEKVYYDGGGSLATSDSSVLFNIAYMYEGDSNDDFVSDIYNENDKAFLESIGDNIENAYRSGVIEDSTGAYVLVSDSLPDSVFIYVGNNNGDYRINFSYVGKGAGAYNYVGSERFIYVGDNRGDYNPTVLVPAPVKTAYLFNSLKITNKSVGEVDLIWNISDFDKNRYSSLDDSDNKANYWKYNYHRKFHNRESLLSSFFYFKENNYKSNVRITSADDDYRFMLPADFIKKSDELKGEIKSNIKISDRLKLKPGFSILEYKNDFRSYRSILSLVINPTTPMTFESSYLNLQAKLDDTLDNKKGEENRFDNRISVDWSRSLKSTASFSYSRRTNDYADTLKGTKLFETDLSLAYRGHSIGYKRTQEDSLISDWEKLNVYNNISLTSLDNKGSFRYKSYFSYNKNETQTANEDYWLSRLNLNYLNYKKQLSLNSSYLMSRETRNSRGIRYIEVNNGEGDYILEDSIYVADPNGNYIKVEEILSDQSKVDRSEKSFSFSKKGSIFKIDLNSQITEELLDFSQRNLLWLIPFYSDEKNEFFYFNRRYTGNLKLFSIKNDYLLTLSAVAEREIRTISGSLENKNSQKYSAAIKQKYDRVDFEEKIDYLKEKKDSYYNLARDLKGVELSFKTLIKFDKLNLNSKVRYRNLKDSKDQKSSLYSVLVGSRIRIVERSEIRNSFELYYQDNNQIENSLVFNEYKPGEYGIEWSLTAQQGIKKDSRLNLSIRGRHADNQSARITGRMELVAGF